MKQAEQRGKEDRELEPSMRVATTRRREIRLEPRVEDIKHVRSSFWSRKRDDALTE